MSRPLRLLRRGRPAILVALLAAVAMAFHAVRRARAGAPAAPALGSRLLPVLVPGLASAAAGRVIRAYGALWLLSALVLALLAGAGGVGYSVPWRYDPGGWFLQAVAGALLLGWLTVRGVRVARAGA